MRIMSIIIVSLSLHSVLHSKKCKKLEYNIQNNAMYNSNIQNTVFSIHFTYCMLKSTDVKEEEKWV